MVRNYQNADCSLRNMLSFIIIFGALSFRIGPSGHWSFVTQDATINSLIVI